MLLSQNSASGTRIAHQHKFQMATSGQVLDLLLQNWEWTLILPRVVVTPTGQARHLLARLCNGWNSPCEQYGKEAAHWF